MTLLEAYKLLAARDFTSRFQSTICFNKAINQYCLVGDLSVGEMCVLHKCESKEDADGRKQEQLVKVPVNIRQAGDSVVLGPVPGRFYNSVEDKQTYYIHKLPKRTPKQGSVPGNNVYARSTFWDSFPNSIVKELIPITKYGGHVNESSLHFLHLLNNHKNFNFSEAINNLVNNKMFSCAFSTQWQVSYTARENHITVFYRAIPVGYADPAFRSVFNSNPLFSQELKDLFNKTGVQWGVK